MAEVVKELPGPEQRQSKYAKYLDGRAWKLSLGKDCPATMAIACNSITLTAKRLGIAVKVSKRKAENAIYVQAILEEPK